LSLVLFLEVSGEAGPATRHLERARAALAALPGFVGARRLGAAAQPGLYLLEVEWRGEAPDLEAALPEAPGLKRRAWAFEVLEPS
jgi:hypothetical protein